MCCTPATNPAPSPAPEDGGATWQTMDTSRVRYPDVTTYMPPLGKRVIGLCADPSNPDDVYGAIEVGGLIASRDGGASWDSLTDGLYRDNHTVDLHGVQVSAAAPGTVFIIAQVAMFRSRNKGRNWEHIRFGEMFPGGSYCRGLLVRARRPPDHIPRGRRRAAAARHKARKRRARSSAAADAGESWQRIDIGDEPPGRMFPDSHRPQRAEQYLLHHQLRPLLRQRRRRRRLDAR